MVGLTKMTTVSSAFTYNSVLQPNLVRATLTSAVEPTTITGSTIVDTVESTVIVVP